MARQLLSRGVPVVGTDMADIRFPGVEVLRVPPATDPAMPAALRRIVAEQHIDLVVPTVSEELPIFAACGQKLGNADVVIAKPWAVCLADDKFRTATRLRACGVEVPKFGLPSDYDGFGAASAVLGSPLVIKPRVSRGGRGVRVVWSAHEVEWHDLDDRWIVQEFAPSTEYAPVVYRSADVDRRADLVVVLDKLGLAGGVVGNATAVRRVPDGRAADVAASALAAVRALGLSGPADVDVRRLSDGRAAVLEVNARFGANSAAAPELLDRLLATTGGMSVVA